MIDEFTALTEGTVADCSGITYERLDDSHAVRWPAPDDDSAGGYRYYDDESWSFPTSSGRAQFSTGRQGTLPEPTDDDYPLTLTTAREADGYNTGVRSRGGEAGARWPASTPRRLRNTANSSPTRHDRRDPSRLCDSRHRPRRGRSPRDGRLPIHRPATNRLTLSDRDPQSDEPNFKQCAARLVAAEAELSPATAD